ncbi:hypothetical protein [Microbacterium hydrocarbonoxydans]|uniref:hypothetical protein n=1 Tax=Microbacterium hydrocarbonoxydans TaxID=273678 RepID=UPI00203F930D|nr:hypothetical protein [Microbacterium hydrocarbonoxydans]MCM3778732.1 hypothetical protein [Microbacterium hydrocarbonoxydans]
MKPLAQKRLSVLATALISTAALVLASTTGASAAQDEMNEAPEALADSIEQVLERKPELVIPRTDLARATEGGTLVSAGPGTVRVGEAAETGVQLEGWTPDPLTLHLPLAHEASDAVVLDEGVIAFPGKSSSSAVIVGEVGVQVLTTIADDQAPTRFAHRLALAPEHTLSSRDGIVEIVDERGRAVVTIAAPWAMDADGDAIPTAYEVDGNTLTQIVDHTTSDVSYPVVADPIFIAPWVFRCLIGLGLSGPQITAAFASGTIWGGLGRAALACALGR